MLGNSDTCFGAALTCDPVMRAVQAGEAWSQRQRRGEGGQLSEECDYMRLIMKCRVSPESGSVSAA